MKGALGELMHLGGQNAYYTDRDFAEIVHRNFYNLTESINIDKKKYEKFVSPKDPTVATYSNDKEGIIYTVNEENDDVTAIEYLPTAKDCQEVMRRAKHAGVQSSRAKARCVSFVKVSLMSDKF